MAFRAAVALVLAGSFRGSNETSSEFSRVLVAPLLAARLRVDVFVAGESWDEARWREWVAPAAPSSFTFAAHAATPARTLNESHFHCDCPGWCVNYAPTVHEQYRKLEEAWRLVQRANVSYDYVVKARNDLLFHPNQTFRACWLLELPPRAVLANDVELNHSPVGNRWNERGGGGAWPQFPTPYYPAHVSDQLLAGTPAALAPFLELDGAPQPPGGRWEVPGRSEACPKIPWNIESVAARALHDAGVGVFTVSLQLRKQALQQGGLYTSWLAEPCRACYDCVSHSVPAPACGAALP
jgi:hypothetical protein